MKWPEWTFTETDLSSNVGGGSSETTPYIPHLKMTTVEEDELPRVIGSSSSFKWKQEVTWSAGWCERTLLAIITFFPPKYPNGERHRRL